MLESFLVTAVQITRISSDRMSP